MDAGEPIEVAELEGELDPVCVRLVRLLRHSARRVVAFVSASEGTPTARFLVQLGVTARLVTGERVTLVDPARAWPPVRPRAGREATLLGRAAEPSGAATSFFEEVALHDGVFALRPFEAAPPGARGELLALLIAHGRTAGGSEGLRRPGSGDTAGGRVFVDLADPGRIGEFLGSASLLDGVVVLGVAGRTTERELEELCAIVPASVDLGVVLLDGA